MDARSRNKSLFRAKLNALKKEKRIESPLVRYNESDQPVCKVCDVVLKSESLWDAHQASRKHHEAIANLKASAAALTRGTNSAGSQSNLLNPRPEDSKDIHKSKGEPSTDTAKLRPTPALPPDFFDGDSRKIKAGSVDSARIGDDTNKSSVGSVVKTSSTQPAGAINQEPPQTAVPAVKHGKGAIPEGFFDNKDADLHARGIKPVKIDVKDEYKEFEKLIQADLQEVDDRMEEEEIDAAEMIEEAESMEQKVYRERVEIFRKKKLELKAARSAKRQRISEKVSKDPSSGDSSSDEDTVENFAVDWRAQHL